MSTEPVPSPSPSAATPPASSTPTTPTTPDPVAAPAAAPSLLEGKPADPAAAPVVTLTDKDFSIPEGVTIDAPLMTEFVEFANSAKLTKEQANGLLALQQKYATASAEKLQAGWETLQQEMQTEVKSDPEVGGEKLAPTLDAIGKVLTKYPRAEQFRKLLTDTGAGNHVEAVKFMAWVAKHMNEGAPIVGAPSAGQQSLANRMFPTMN